MSELLALQGGTTIYQNSPLKFEVSKGFYTAALAICSWGTACIHNSNKYETLLIKNFLSFFFGFSYYISCVKIILLISKLGDSSDMKTARTIFCTRTMDEWKFTHGVAFSMDGGMAIPRIKRRICCTLPAEYAPSIEVSARACGSCGPSHG